MGNNAAHVNMVKQQIKTMGVTDPVIIHLLENLPREHFVPEEYASMAYAEISIPMGHEQIMLPPSVIARLLQAVKIKGTDKVCLVGTGGGYLAALLARLAHHVYSIDLHTEINLRAQQKCSALGINNISFIKGDAARGWPEFAPYDVLIFTGSMAALPKCVAEQIATGGRIFVVLGQMPAMQATLYTQIEAKKWQAKTLFETVIPALANAPTAEPFIF